MPKATLNIDRKTASKILGVSVRTIDRHIRTGRLVAYRENGRIWLNKADISKMKNGAISIVRQTIDKPNNVHIVSAGKKTGADGDFYKDLYQEAKKALEEYRQKLDQSNYRIGQLESQLLHCSSPKTHERTDFINDILRKEAMDREKEFMAIKELCKRERASRIIFSVLTYVLLLSLPLMWYLLR